MRLLFLLPLLALGCQSSPDPVAGRPAAGELGARSAEDLPDPSMIEDVSPAQTAELLAGGARPVSPSFAIQTIDLWIARLDTASAEGVGEVRGGLDQLRDLLQSNPLDGRAIGLQMKEIAEATAALPDSSRQLGALVSTLRAAGRQLAPDSTAAGAGSAGVQ